MSKTTRQLEALRLLANHNISWTCPSERDFVFDTLMAEEILPCDIPLIRAVYELSELRSTEGFIEDEPPLALIGNKGYQTIISPR